MSDTDNYKSSLSDEATFIKMKGLEGQGKSGNDSIYSIEQIEAKNGDIGNVDRLAGIGESQKEEEKRKAGETAMAVAQAEINAEYSAIQKKHSSFIRELEAGTLFKNPASFDSDFKAFDLFADDSLKLISNKNTPDTVYLEVVNQNMTAARSLNAVKSLEENEAHIIATQGKAAAESSNVLKLQCLDKTGEMLEDCGMAKHPSHCKTMAEIREFEEAAGIKFSELDKMPLEEVKAKHAGVAKFKEIKENKEAYTEFMKNPDTRLDAFRDKDFEQLSKRERFQLLKTTVDITHEQRDSELYNKFITKGYSTEKATQMVALAQQDKYLWDSGNITDEKINTWTKNIDLEAAGQIDPALRGQVTWDMENYGKVSKNTYAKILNNMSSDDFSAYAKSLLPNSNGDRAVDTERLRELFRSSPEFAANTSTQLKSSIEALDKQNATLAENAGQPKSLFSFWQSTSPVNETAKIASIAAVSPMAASLIVAGNAIANAVDEKPTQSPTNSEKSPEAKTAFEGLTDKAKAAVEEIAKACGCKSEKDKEKEKTTPTVPVERNAPPFEVKAPEPLANNSAKPATPVNPNNLPQSGGASAPSVG